MSKTDDKNLLSTVAIAAVSMVLAFTATGAIAFGFVTGHASGPTLGQYVSTQAQAVVAGTAIRS